MKISYIVYKQKTIFTLSNLKKTFYVSLKIKNCEHAKYIHLFSAVLNKIFYSAFILYFFINFFLININDDIKIFLIFSKLLGKT